ncbi:MAG: response regulator transcription factor [Saprospiraceae bacterium]|nr:response regulator transcription factor [Saprospiraceae bacterium]
MINVVLADDHKIVVDGLVSILKEEEDINIVGTAYNGQQALEIIKENKVDIAVIDIEMPVMTGIQLSKYLNEHHPEVKVLILSMYKTQDFVEQIVSAGAKGYVLKNKGSEELVKAIRYIHDGQSYIGQEITDVLIEALKAKSGKAEQPNIQFTKREKEILALIAQGLTSIKIGEKLFIAPSTVDTHRRNLIEKTGVANSKELIRVALENKLLIAD